MLLTETDAKTRWCPMVRYADHYHGSTFNRGGLPNNVWDISPDSAAYLCNCIASRCMMWRWLADDTLRGRFDKPTAEEAARRLGFCGLAGASRL